MHIRFVPFVLAVTLALPAMAEQANIQPGQWEYTNVSRFEGLPMPEQTYTHRECITMEDIEKGEAFLENPENCKVTNMDLRRDGMNYALVCTQQGMTMDMNAQMRFMGDRVEGKMLAKMQGPMGPMQMHMDIKGQRVGDC